MRDFFSRHGMRVLILAALLAVLVSVFSFLASTSPWLRNAAGVISAPFQRGMTAVENWIADKRRYYEDYTALAEENAALRREIAQMEDEVRQSRANREENALLRTLLGLQEKERSFTYEPAYIIARNSSNWSSVLTLDRGSAQGVAVNDCVVSAEHYLIGVVSEVGLNWCSVRTLVDTETEIGARVFRSGDIAVAEGDFALMLEGQLSLAYLPAEGALLVGDYIVTSGLGGYFPPDLVLGTISAIRADDGIERYAIIDPMADFDALSEVFVIKDFSIVH